MSRRWVALAQDPVLLSEASELRTLAGCQIAVAPRAVGTGAVSNSRSGVSVRQMATVRTPLLSSSTSL